MTNDLHSSIGRRRDCRTSERYIVVSKSDETLYFWDASNSLMLYFNDRVRQSVCFVAIKTSPSGPYKYLGTAFFVGWPLGGGMQATYVVTARHVLKAVAEQSVDHMVYLRVNTRNGACAFSVSKLSDWITHESNEHIDVAVLPQHIPQEWEHWLVPMTSFATRRAISELDVFLGQQLFIVGLFKHRQGESRNIPIVRIGNLAAFPEEPVVSKDWGRVDPAYLIESRSIRGLSGSPVFVAQEYISDHFSSVSASLSFDGKPGDTKIRESRLNNVHPVLFTESQPITPGSIPIATSPRHTMSVTLLGLMHGHWDARDCEIAEDAIGDERAVNMGIAIVVASDSILEVLNQDRMREHRKTLIDKMASDEIVPHPD